MGNVVLLDDNFAIRQLVGILLAELRTELDTDFHLYASENGVEGLGYIYITNPDLIVIDTTLPKYSGREVLEFLTSNKRFHESQTKVIVLEESSSTNFYPQNFIVIHKRDPHFLEELLTTIGKTIRNEYQYQSSFFRSLAGLVIRLSNYNDTLAHKNQLHNYWLEPLSYIPWLVRELVVSFIIAFIFLIKNQVQNQSIEQTTMDLRKFRVKYYPTMVIGASALLILAFQVTFLVLPQLVLLQAMLSPASAASTFTVDSLSDDSDFLEGDGVCDTDDSNGDGPCSLRAAIQEANALAGADVIQVAVGSGDITFTLNPLPAINESLVIDASTQPGSDCDTHTLAVNLNPASPGSEGFEIANGDVTIKGFAIGGYSHGILAKIDADNINIECNNIGITTDGSTTSSNETGIRIVNGSVTIGGTSVSKRNVISANTTGIYLEGGTTTVAGNFIGTTASGNDAAGNSIDGIYIQSASNTIGGASGTTPGGACSGACNLISNNRVGINILSSHNTIAGNHLGFNNNGDNASNSEYAIKMQYANDNTIGGDSNYERNYFGASGIANISLQASNDNEIIGNYIGLNPMEIYTPGSTPIGIDIGSIGIDGSTGNQIGSTTTGEANYINADVALSITGTNTADNVVSGNYIGTDSTNTQIYQNQTAIYIESESSQSVIDHNVIANSNFECFLVSSNPNIHHNQISNCSIGIALSGGDGADVYDNQISSTEYAILTGHSTTASSIHGNTTAHSSSFPIDLQGDGPTSNDFSDIDTGDNDLLNYPEILEVYIHPYNQYTDIMYAFDSAAGDYQIDFYKATEAHTTGFGEASEWLCSQQISHDGSFGGVTYNFECPQQAADADLTANATQIIGVGDYGASSELSVNFKVTLRGTAGSVEITEPVHVGNSLNVTVTDLDLNINSSTTQTVSIVLTNTTTGELESMQLTEASVNSNIFSGILPTTFAITAGADDNGILNLQAGDELQVSYLDVLNDLDANVELNDTSTAQNGLPVANNDVVTAVSGQTFIISPLANDLDPEGQFNLASLIINSNPSHGIAGVIVANGTISYTPTTAYLGADTMQYTICDAATQCANAQISIVVSEYSPTPSPTVTPSATATPVVTPDSGTPTTEPTVLRPTPTPAAFLSPVPSPTVGVAILPETGGGDFSLTPAALGDTISSSLVAVPAIVFVVTRLYSYPGMLFYGLAWLHRAKRKQPWGVVYDQETMAPIAFARVSLWQGEKIIADKVTDMQGRFGFSADQGEYTLVAEHPDYQKYSKTFKQSAKAASITADLGLSQKGLAFPRLKLKDYLDRLNVAIFVIGFIFSLIAIVMTLSTYNIAVFILYALQAVIAAAITKHNNSLRSWGYVYDANSGSRIKGTFIRLYDTVEQRQLDVQITDAQGRYGFLVKPGRYLLSADHPAYRIPSVKENLGRYFVGAGGRLLTNITVKNKGTINLAISADAKDKENGAELPSPFGGDKERSPSKV